MDENPISRGTALILDVGDLLILSRRIRDLPNTALDVLPPRDLRKWARQLRGVEYNARTAARRFEIRADRVEARP